CGGSGYTGAELMRILSQHPEVTITAVTSEKYIGKKVSSVFPHLHYYDYLSYEPLVMVDLLPKADLFFMALPHGTSQEVVNYFFTNEKKVIDLSADYRLSNPLIYEEWYKTPHNFKETLKSAVYGLPEIYRDKIRNAKLIANPGCYPTSVILGLYPTIKEKIVDLHNIIIDSKSGTSGAGRKASQDFSYCEVNEGFKPYAIGVHRHTPEIEQELSSIAGEDITVNFTPHLVPMDRGIISTIYCKLKRDLTTLDILSLYRETYEKEPFIKVLDEGTYPNTKDVRGTNFCEIGIKVVKRTATLIIVSVIDNLVKGASGQAVHNMNLMMNFKETTALHSLALFP
ncbi:MAG: N-acetyl-gamma-glutamyl-phosphate reductase, partial [Thermodesulfovibrionales bacterium]|nr:N-acetyl-gamma-glutamyl-phosphate reductase [Thermodesulfovibrionales bacterium]